MKRLIGFIFVAVLWGTVLAFGAVEAWAYTLAEVVLFAAVLLLVVRQTREGTIRLPLPVWPVLFLFAVAFELVPLPPSLVQLLSPRRWLDMTVVTGTAVPRWTSLSVYPHDTQVALLQFAACLCAFVLAAWLHDSRSHRSLVLGALVTLGCFEAAWGLVQALTGWSKVFGYTKLDVYEATGTYVNRNHFAGFLEMVLPFAFGFAFYHVQHWLEATPGRALWPRPAASGGAGARTVFFLVVLSFLMLAVVFSRSRAGILVAVFSLLFVALLTQARFRRKGWGLSIFLLFMVILGYGLWIGLGPVLSRFEALRGLGEIRGEVRLALWNATLRLWRDFALTGTGWGTFGVAFKPYQSTLVTYYVDHAHNDYLEAVAETGLVGAVLLFVPILALFVRMVLSFLDDPSRYRRAITLGSIGATLAMLLHSLLDFNLHIPANALVFAAVLGIGYKTSIVERQERGNRAVKSPDQ